MREGTMRGIVLALVLASAAGSGCARRTADAAGAGSPYLFVWAGPHDTTHKQPPANDFVAVLDVARGSAAYGRVLASKDVGVAGEMAHHTEYTLPAGRPLFANDYMTGRIFLVDLAQPTAPRLIRRIDAIPGFRRPHSFARLANGHVLATLQFGNGSLPGDPGGLAELDADGRLLRTASAADPAFPGARIRTYGLEVLPAIDRVVTTSSPMDDERAADIVQLWRLSDLRLLRTLAVPGIAGDSVQEAPFEVRALPDGRSAFLNTYNCGFYYLSELDTEHPKIELVHALLSPRWLGCSVPVEAAGYWIMPVAYGHSVISLDIRDPRHPREVSVLRADGNVLPHWSALDPRSDRIAIVGQDDGEARVLLARLDRATGRLSWDTTFHEPGSARPGIGFGGRTFPHGRVADAMPHAALFGPPPGREGAR